MISIDLNQKRTIRNGNLLITPFSTSECMTSISVSDYLDKILVSLGDGSLILSTSHKTWKSNDDQAFAVILIFYLITKFVINFVVFFQAHF